MRQSVLTVITLVFTVVLSASLTYFTYDSFKKNSDDALDQQVTSLNEEFRLFLQTSIQQSITDTIALQEHIMVSSSAVSNEITSPELFRRHCSRERIFVLSKESIHSEWLMLYNISQLLFLNDVLASQGYPPVTRVTPTGESIEEFFSRGDGGFLTAQLTAYPAIPSVTAGQAFSTPLFTAANVETVVNKTTILLFRRSLTSGNQSYIINTPLNIAADGRVMTYISSFSDFQVGNKFDSLQLSFHATDVRSNIVIFENKWDNRDSSTMRTFVISTCNSEQNKPIRAFSTQFPICRDILVRTALKRDRETLQPISADDVLLIMCCMFAAIFGMLLVAICILHKSIDTQTKLNTQIISVRVQENTHASTLRYLNHEIRNPLAIALKNTEDLMKALEVFASKHNPQKRWINVHSPHRRFLNGTKTAIRTCESVMNDLIMFGRADTAIPSLQIKSTELILRLRDAMFQSLCMFDTSFGIVAFIHDSLKESLMVDAARIRQILSNCLCNALQHGSSKNVRFYAHFVADPTNPESGFIVFNIFNSGSVNTTHITNLIHTRMRERTTDRSILESLSNELPKRFRIPRENPWLTVAPINDNVTEVELSGQAAAKQIIASDKTTVGLTVTFTVIATMRGFLYLQNTSGGHEVRCTLVIPTALGVRPQPTPSFDDLACLNRDDIV